MLLRPSKSSSSSRAAPPAGPAAAAAVRRWGAWTLTWACVCAVVLGAGGRGAEAVEGAVRGHRGAAASGVVAATAEAAAGTAGDRKYHPQASDPRRRSLQPNQVVIDFTDYPDGQLGNVYEQRYGVVFSPNAWAHQISDQSKYFPIVYFYSETPGDSYFTVANGCTGSLSFTMYNSARSEDRTLTFAAYDGPSVTTGIVLGQTTVTAAPGSYTTVRIRFPGVAKAFGFYGPNLFDGEFTNITFTPAEQSTCTATTYWLWDPTADQVVAEIKDGETLCVPQPYNIEARPCSDPAAAPVALVLKNAAGRNLYRRNEGVAPFFLWGDDPVSGDVFRNLKRLPDGTYSLQTTIDGVVETISFTKRC